jgi:hypothetical protein
MNNCPHGSGGLDSQGDGAPWAGFHAPTTPAAILVDESLFTHHVNCVHETNAIRAGSATRTVCRFDGNFHTGHFGELGPRLRGHRGQHFVQAATRTTVADCEQAVSGTHAKPERVQFISADEVDEARLPAFLDVRKRLLFRYRVSEPGINAPGGLAEEQASEFSGVILAVRRLPANTKIHDPAERGFFNEMLNNLRRQYELGWRRHRGVHRNNLVLRQKNHVVGFEQ